METITLVSDYRDPSEPDGHRQEETVVERCSVCGEGDDILLMDDENPWVCEEDIEYSRWYS